MAPKNKRVEDGEVEDSKRATKVARTSKNGAAPKNGTKKGPVKAPLFTEEFAAKALPLHVNLTHTPPSITKDGAINSEGQEEHPTPVEVATDSTSGDVGFIGNLTLVPTTFSTGSYGWKGSKKIIVELQSGDVNAQGEREKVQVMLSVNATVVGSKPSKEGKEKKEKQGSPEEIDEEETEAVDNKADGEEDKA